MASSSSRIMGAGAGAGASPPLISPEIQKALAYLKKAGPSFDTPENREKVSQYIENIQSGYEEIARHNEKSKSSYGMIHSLDTEGYILLVRYPEYAENIVSLLSKLAHMRLYFFMRERLEKMTLHQAASAKHIGEAFYALHQKVYELKPEYTDIKILYKPITDRDVKYDMKCRKLFVSNIEEDKKNELVCYVYGHKVSLNSLNEDMAQTIRNTISNTLDLDAKQTEAIFDAISQKGFASHSYHQAWLGEEIFEKLVEHAKYAEDIGHAFEILAKADDSLPQEKYKEPRVGPIFSKTDGFGEPAPQHKMLFSLPPLLMPNNVILLISHGKYAREVVDRLSSTNRLTSENLASELHEAKRQDLERRVSHPIWGNLAAVRHFFGYRQPDQKTVPSISESAGARP